MRRLAVMTAAVALVGGLLAMSPSAAAPAYAGPQDGIGWQYSESANGYWRAPQADSVPTGGDSGPALVWVQHSSTNELLCPETDPAFACAEDDPEAYIRGITCGTALRGPRGLPLFAWIRWERRIGPDGQPTKWSGQDADCDEPGEDDFIPMEEISWEVNYKVFQELERPAITISPAGRTLVNLPTIVSTDYPAGLDPEIVVANDPPTIEIPIHIDRPNGGLDGQIRAQADLVWTFEGGGSATGRGRPYVEGITPDNRPGYYVTNTFEHPGPKNVSLAVTWTGRVTVDLLDPEDIDPVALAPVTQTIEVADSSPVLER
ncbi:hypothetical protein [Actinopolymorpha pittospori]|uniref:PKD domain-containing protein n=1 Tax=Actinopolymorpha pittospori TaxID=648752 RepID=A0A927MW81_9ACTN|nr:hypothetical protein [Actinopolymorpha pittospori]MBE1607571.1 hypothetical protein [Actinopolymorpha pittospori]